MRENVLSYLEELEEENRRLREKCMEWINVKDRLPETNMRCLCATEYYNRIFYNTYYFSTNLYEVDNMDFLNEKGNAGFYNYDSEWGYYKISDVKYWMPIPELNT